MSVPALSEEQARQLAADEYRGFGPEQFEVVDDRDADYGEYPDPVESDREVNAHDIWLLRVATRDGKRVGLQGKHKARKNPTEYTIQALLDEWDDATDIPLGDHDALQQAAGIGTHRAHQVVGAAVANGLVWRAVERPDHAE